jgi:hypothetical protein
MVGHKTMGILFTEALGYYFDQLDPMDPQGADPVAYILGIDNYEYSRYQL